MQPFWGNQMPTSAYPNPRFVSVLATYLGVQVPLLALSARTRAGF